MQLGNTSKDKSQNLAHARQQVVQAANHKQDGKRTDVIVLPECFNSPYGHEHFDGYAESIDFDDGKPYDVAQSASETVKMLSSAAKETGVWLFGGKEQDALHLLVSDIDSEYVLLVRLNTRARS